MKFTFAGVAAACLLFAGESSAQSALEACVNQSSGTVKLVAADQPCGNKEARVVWNIAGPQGPAGPPGPEGPPGPPGMGGGGGSLQVVDSSTPPLTVGHLAGVQQVIMTPADDPAAFFAVYFNTAGFVQHKIGPWFVYYQSANCAGDAYVNSTSYGKAVIEAYVWDGYVHYANEPLNPALNTAVSYSTGASCGTLMPPMNSTSALTLLRKRPVTDFTVRPEGTLTPPFRLQGQ